MWSDELGEKMLFVISERKRLIGNDLRCCSILSISLFRRDLWNNFTNLPLYPFPSIYVGLFDFPYHIQALQNFHTWRYEEVMEQIRCICIWFQHVSFSLLTRFHCLCIRLQVLQFCIQICIACIWFQPFVFFFFNCCNVVAFVVDFLVIV